VAEFSSSLEEELEYAKKIKEADSVHLFFLVLGINSHGALESFRNAKLPSL
jgi:hypothetical protein